MNKRLESSQEFLNEIKNLPYWQVIIRPNIFKKDNIERLDDIIKLVRDCQVSLRGWSYPHLSNRNTIPIEDYILSWASSMFGFKEYWRFYRSCQFVHFFIFREDLDKKNISKDFKESGILYPTNTLFLITEIFEFTSRLAEKNILADSLEISVTLHQTQNRVIVPDSNLRNIDIYECPQNSIEIRNKYSVSQLLTQSRDYSLKFALQIFEQFQYTSPPIELLKELQEKLIKKII